MVDLKKLQAYNVKLKKLDKMKVDAVVKTPITKEGKKTGKFRYRLAGTGTDGTGMSKFVKKEDADSVADALGLDIEERQAKKKTVSKSCKAIAQRAADKCTESRGQKRKLMVVGAKDEEEEKPKKKVVKKAAPKKRKVVKKSGKKGVGRPKKK